MLPKDTSVPALLLALALAGIAGSGGFEARQALVDKAQAQSDEVSAFQEWSRKYTQLLPIEKRWTESFSSAAAVKDLFSVYRRLGEVPHTNPDKLIVTKVERLTLNGKELGGQRMCLGTAGDQGLVFEEASFEPLMAGLRTLSERVDVQMGVATFTYHEGKARASMQNFCLLFRDPEPSDNKPADTPAPAAAVAATPGPAVGASGVPAVAPAPSVAPLPGAAASSEK